MRKYILLFFKGVIIGFGAIMPGISGGSLCVAFGMYHPIIELLAEPFNGIKKYWKSFLFFFLGGFAGFIGLSGFAAWLILQNANAITCLFAGLILGTLPDLWNSAGRTGRNCISYTALIAGFIIIFSLLIFIKTHGTAAIQPGLWSYCFCGILWGIGIIIPGLSPSTLLLFFGLYHPMLDGIATLSADVIIPLFLGTAVCLLLFSKGISALFKKFYSAASHSIIGIIFATTILVLPDFSASQSTFILYTFCLLSGTAATYIMGKICSKINRSTNISR